MLYRISIDHASWTIKHRSVFQKTGLNLNITRIFFGADEYWFYIAERLFMRLQFISHADEIYSRI